MLIVILDDVELNNVLMREAVRGIPNSQAVEFTDPVKALSFLETNAANVGVIITDYDMPTMNGLEFTSEVRRRSVLEHAPIIVVTSMNQRKNRRDALAAGATDFLGKPFDAVEVRARVSNLLSLARARQLEQGRADWLARKIAIAVKDIEAREQEIVTRLVRAAEHRDSETGDHIIRVASYAAMIAQHLGFDRDYCARLKLASTMHDVGKIGVPDAVLLKAGPLTPDERSEMERHAEQGSEILANSTSDVIRLAAEIALTHHERWDGGGYPRKLSGEAIPLSGRIVAVADVYDALVSTRPYKSAWSSIEALNYLKQNAGTQFDSACVNAFIAGLAACDAELSCYDHSFLDAQNTINRTERARPC